MVVQLLVVWLCLFGIFSAQNITYDGVIRPNSAQPGRYDAYFVPPFISNHASFIEYVQGSGSLITAWFSGTGEGQSGVAIVTSILPANGTKWTNATVISQKIGYSSQNPVLICNASNEIYAFHTQFPAGQGEATSIFYTLNSVDGGKTFSTPTPIFTPQTQIWDRNRILPTLSGGWLFPLYMSVAQGDDYSFIYYKPPSVAVESNSWVQVPLPNSSDLIQPTLNRITPGQPFLRAYFRDENQQYIYTATSPDDGKSWTDAEPTELPNNNSGISSYVLASGNIAIVYNPLNSGRNVLAISLSIDQGLTWKFTRILENHTSGEFSYPCILQTEDGTIHLTYTYLRETIKYTRISEDWIAGIGSN
jgi:predicted neuraminidase